jgi:hypothetical protein
VTDVASVVLLVSVFVALGFGVVLALGVPLTGGWAVTAVGLAPLLGMLACGFVGMWTAALGIGLSLLLVVAVVLAIVGIALFLRRGRSATLWTPRTRVRRRLFGVVEVGLLCALGVVGVAIVRLFAVSSLGQWDGWAIWGLHAHALYADGTATGPVFTSPVYGGGHPEYPILFPTLEALFGEATGRFDPTLILVLPALMLIFVAVALWAVLRTVIPPALAAATALAVMGTPAIVESFRGNYADGAVSTIAALGALCLLIWVVSGSSASLALASALLACSGLIKTEGLMFSLAAVIAALIAASGQGTPLRPLAPATFAIAAPAVAWMALVHFRGVQSTSYRLAFLSDPGYLESNGYRFTRAASAMLNDVGRSWTLPAALLIPAICLAILARRAWPAVFLLVWTAISFIGLAISYLISTAPIEWHLATSSSRVVFTLAVGTAVLAPIVAVDAWDRLDPLSALRAGVLRQAGSPTRGGVRVPGDDAR